MRPIDADAVEAACESLADKLRREGQKTDAELFEALASIIKYCPTLDVEPIRRAKWVQEDEECWRCSACGILWTFIVDGPDENGVHYCPVCGAKIDVVPADVVPAVGSPVDGCPAVGKAGDVDAT